MEKQDYYSVLGAARGADADALKKAYRKKAKELHPDRNKDDPEAETKFKAVNEAYDVLKDPQKRAAYDQYGHAAFENGMGGGGGRGPQGNPDFASAFSDVFDDLFGDFMGQRGRPGGGGGRFQAGGHATSVSVGGDKAESGPAVAPEIKPVESADAPAPAPEAAPAPAPAPTSPSASISATSIPFPGGAMRVSTPAGFATVPLPDLLIVLDLKHKPPQVHLMNSFTPLTPHGAAPDSVMFHRTELSVILSLYGRMVAAGEWRDYGISHLKDCAVFSIFRRAAEHPVYSIEKRPALAQRQGAFSVIAMDGRIEKRGRELGQVLRVFDRKLIRAVGEG